uniref:Protein translocase subunit seca n=1 Tax=Anopheles darlingi TaxID=43151 RepID=A0A2M4DSD8_ANODA
MKNEIVFLEALLDFLHCFKSINSTYLSLYLNEFCLGKISVSELIAKIGSMKDQYSEDRFRRLQTVASKLKSNNSLYLKNEFNAALSSFLKPVKVSKKAIDARSIIEVTGTYIVVSECLKSIEQILQAETAKGTEVHEVHFVGALVVHIDTDLNNEIWHGRNIVVCTRMVSIHGSVTWNVSGKNADHIYSTKAGTDDEDNGIRGKDGYPGESGGNVLVVTDKIENSTALKVISNGGNGSNGQDGGDGRDGRNGTGISKNSIDERFPPPCRFKGKEHGGRVQTIIKSIQSAAASVKTAWIDGSTMSLDTLLKNYKEQTTVIADIFIEGKTDDGNEIVFSSDCGLLARQSFFLYKGTNGTSGHMGGNYGLGGQGGYPGAVMIESLGNSENQFVIQTEVVVGTDGKSGKKGINGKSGKNGWDMGYLNYWTWSSVEYYGTSEDEKLRLERFNYSTSTNVWSEYYDRYVGFEAIKNEHSKQTTYEQSTSATCSTERQHHALAVNKKTVSKQSILDQYSLQMNSLVENRNVNNSKMQQHLHHVNSMATKIGETLANQIQNKKQQQAVFKTTRHCKYVEASEHSNDVSEDELLHTIRQQPIDMDLLVANLNEHKLTMHYWFQLTNIQLGDVELNRLLEAIKTSSVLRGTVKNSETWKIIQSILDEKCRLVALNKIAKIFPIYLNITGDIKVQAESATNCLLVGKNVACFSDDPSSSLKQYLWNEERGLRKKVFQYCTDINKDRDAVLWSTLVRTFFIELKNPTEKVMHLHEKYHFYAQKCSQELIVFRESLQKLDNQCRDEPNVMKEMKKFLLEKGPLSKCYRLLLANMLNVNIRTYIRGDGENKFSLNDNQNPEANEVIHLLLTDDGLHEIFLDKARLEMEVERRLKSQMFYKILAEVEPLRRKQEFNEYFPKLSKFIERMNGVTRDDLYEVETSKNKRPVKSQEERKNDKALRDRKPPRDSFKCASFENLSEDNSLFRSKTYLSCPDLLKAYEYTGLYLDQMEDLNEIMKYFPEEREKQEIAEKFHKISQYIGYPEIVHNIQRRFACEGRHVSYEEISCLINSVLSTFTDREEHLNIVSWIAAAFSQQNWIDELLLLKIEDFLKMQIADKKEWRVYLSNIKNKKLLVMLHEKLDALSPGSSVSYQCFADIFYLLSKIPHEPLRLEPVEISEWPYVLREKYWIFKLSTLTGSQGDDFTDLLYYLLSVENSCGTDLTEKLIQAIENAKREETMFSEKLMHILCNFQDEKWTLNAQVIQSISHSVTIDSWMDVMEKAFISDGKNRNMKQLIDLIKNNGNTSKNIIDSLPTISISGAVKMGKTAFTREEIKTYAYTFRDAIRAGNRTIRDSLGEILYVIDKAIELERGVTLRDTQKLAILSLTSNPRNTLAQVSTGEGKSLIVAATAIIKALQGKKVHIVTSSTVLAKRDAEENAKIFNIFDVYASHNCNEDIEKRKEAYSNNQVIYGDLSNFQRDYLLDRFYGKRVLGDHDLENVIIDEVDSMLLDKGNNMLYLSHNLAGFDKLEPVYIFIWQWINRPAADSKELSAALDTGAIKEAVLDEIYIRIHKTEIDELYAELNERQKLTIWARMIDANIIDECGNILKENIMETDIDGIVPSNLECATSVKYRLLYILNECIDRIRSIAIPKYLKPFVEQHLECWIRSAVTAFFMKSGEDYVVDLDNTDTSQDRNPNIIIIDRDTGTDLANSQWDEALYQFLQLKHGCKISLQNLKAVFISNVSYFKKYKTLNGLTGTLGTKRDRDLLQEIHDVDYVIIPTAQSKQFHEEKSIVSPTKEDWKKQILYEAKQITNEQKRSVLIICETVNVVNDLYQLFGGRKETNVHTYTRDYEQFEVAKDGHKLNSGQVIIATNLAGRGTDIKISDELNQAGGLHVILTYLPSNIRIEQQAFGRAARCGAKGSGKLIIFNPKGQESVSTKILELKTNRHKQDLNRLAECKVFYDIQITAEEECFEKFNAEYGRLKRDLASKEVPKGLQDLLLESCLDKWAYWLDENSKWINTSHNSLGKTKYQIALKAFIQQLKSLSTGATECSVWDKVKAISPTKKLVYDSSCWIEWVKDNPPQMVKLGKYLSQNLKEFNNTYDTAIELFDGVIRGDPNFSEVARYYKASVLIKQVESGGESIINSVKTEFRLAAKLFEMRIEQHSKAASIIGNIKSNNTESLIQINAFEDQQRHFMELYNEFITTINNILGHPVSSDCFVSQIPSINKQLANAIFAELLHNKVLKPPMVGKELFERDLKVLCDEYGVSVIVTAICDQRFLRVVD